MMPLYKKEKRSQARALVLFLALVGIYLCDINRLLAAPVFVGNVPVREGVLVRLSLNHSAVGRTEKHSSNLKGKVYRHQTTLGSPPISDTLKTIEFIAQCSAATINERPNTLINISPPSDRAPPRI